MLLLPRECTLLKQLQSDGRPCSVGRFAAVLMVMLLGHSEAVVKVCKIIPRIDYLTH